MGKIKIKLKTFDIFIDNIFCLCYNVINRTAPWSDGRSSKVMFRRKRRAASGAAISFYFFFLIRNNPMIPIITSAN